VAGLCHPTAASAPWHTAAISRSNKHGPAVSACLSCGNWFTCANGAPDPLVGDGAEANQPLMRLQRPGQYNEVCLVNWLVLRQDSSMIGQAWPIIAWQSVGQARQCRFHDSSSASLRSISHDFWSSARRLDCRKLAPAFHLSYRESSNRHYLDEKPGFWNAAKTAADCKSVSE